MFRTVLKAYGRTATCVRYNGSAVSTEVLQKLDEGYDKLLKSNSKSLLKKHLTPELFTKLKTKRTKTSTLLDCIQSGLTHHDSACGIYAPCPESYGVFAELFDPIIKDCHFGFKSCDKHPPVDFGDPSVFQDVDPRNNFIASTRIQCARSLKGYPFNPRMTVDHYNHIEDKLHCISTGFVGECKGKYHSLCCLDRAVRMKLAADYHLFGADDRFLEAANAFQHWPIGRGVFRSLDKTFLVWCNEEDHLSIISMQRGGHFGEVYARLIGGLCFIEKYLPFVRDERLGFLTFCPTNLGTAIRASVRIKLPKLAANKAVLEEVAGRYKLQVRSSDGEHTKGKCGLFVISNRRRLGLTEFDAVSDLYCGIRDIIQLEKGQKELKPVRRKPQPAPPHIDPQKAIKSGLIDERKKKRPSASASVDCAMKLSVRMDPKAATKKLSERTKETSKPTKQTAPKSGGNINENKRSVAKKEAKKTETPKKVAAKDAEVKRETMRLGLANARKEAARAQEVTKKETPVEGAVKSPNKKLAVNKSQPNTAEMMKAGSKESDSKRATSVKSPKETTSPSKTSQNSSKKTLASQSTDPCTRAGIKRPK